jgi:hypothetical protein
MCFEPSSDAESSTAEDKGVVSLTQDMGGLGVLRGHVPRRQRKNETGDGETWLLTPNKRKQLLLSCKANIETLKDITRTIEQTLVEGGTELSETAGVASQSRQGSRVPGSVGHRRCRH